MRGLETRKEERRKDRKEEGGEGGARETVKRILRKWR